MVERLYDNSGLTLENILDSWINEKIDEMLAESYPVNKVNARISSEKGSDAA
ncbi:hypothetical protein [Psychrobacillus psychrotolerans]|uniref:hypothetical protein n=1 Tax=Psychrobacillus psychrotolerans TaxID=126156 RepID=UPI003B028D5F